MEDTVLVRMSREVMQKLITRDEKGNRLTFNWGEPDATGVYEPVITVDYSDNIKDAAKEEGYIEGWREAQYLCE